MDQADSWCGQWCWTGKHVARPWNYYAYFRRVVDLPGLPRRCVLRVSASARYILYVNGHRIHQGPARCFAEFQSFDELDVTHLLHAGANTLCAVCFEFGVPTFQSQFRDVSGFLLDGFAEYDQAAVALHTPEQWTCRAARAWRQDTARLSVQLGFEEHFDASADPADWMNAAFDPESDPTWTKPFVQGPVGRHPWLTMEPRGVPLLSDHIVSFDRLLSQFGGRCAEGYRQSPNVYALAMQEEHTAFVGPLGSPQAMFQDDPSVTTIPALLEDEFLMLVLDPADYVTGHFVLDIARATGGEIIDIIYTEDLADPKTAFPHIMEAGGSQVAMGDRYICRAGTQRWEPFAFKGMRYAVMVFRNIRHPLSIRHVAIRKIHTGFNTDAGAFECSDQRLNDIWQVARNTQLNCAFDSFVDCPWREQVQWWGDARVQGKVTAHAFGDHSLLARGIRQMAQSQKSDGALHAHPPADIPHFLPDFMMTWVGTVWDHYFQSGQTQILLESLPTLHRLMEFFARHETDEGLLVNFYDGRWWLFLDWKPLFKEDYCGVLNLMYLQTLRWAAGICRIGGASLAADAYAARAVRMQGAVERYFWDISAKRWRDGFDLKTNTPVHSVSQHMNALAILLDLKPETHLDLARRVLLKGASAGQTEVIEGSPFFYAYIFEAMFKCGLRDEAIAIIRDKWGRMLDTGAKTFWERWGDDHFSRCHAWSASPLYHLSQQVLGVVPTEPAWKQVRIVPAFGELSFAAGAVPTPQGLLRMTWKKTAGHRLSIRIELPAGTAGEFVGSDGTIHVLAAKNDGWGIHQINMAG